MVNIKKSQKHIKQKEIIEQKLTYLDIQILWCFLDALWRIKIVTNTIYCDLDEEFKWETNDRTWSDHDDQRFKYYDLEDYLTEEEIYSPSRRPTGKVKGQKMVAAATGRSPQHTRYPNAVKGNKRK